MPQLSKIDQRLPQVRQAKESTLDVLIELFRTWGTLLFKQGETCKEVNLLTYSLFGYTSVGSP
jgi:hypothetical protein